MKAGQSGSHTQTRYRLLVLVAAASTGFAADTFAASVADIYHAATENDPVLGAAKQDYAAREEAVPQSRSALLPSVGLTGSTSYDRLTYPNGQELDTDPTSATFGQLRDYGASQYNQHSWQLQLTQPLVDIAAYHTYTKSKALNAEAAQDLVASQLDLIVRAVSAYLEVLRSQSKLDSTNAEEAAVKRQQDQIQQRFDVGLVAITDVLDANAAYDNVVVRRIQAERDQGIRFEDLYTVTGTSYEEVDQISPSFPIVDTAPVDENTWVSIALTNSPSVLAARQAQIAAQREVRAEEAGYLPTLDAIVSYNDAVSHAPESAGGQSYLGDTTLSRTYALQLQVPIYQGGYTASKVREVRARTLQASELVRNEEWKVSRDTRNLLRSVTTDVIRVQARLTSIKSSESALEATQAGYQLGTRNIVDVLQAQQALYSAQFDYADSRVNYVRDLFLLKQTAGILSADDVARLNTYTDSQRPIRRVRTTSNPPGTAQ